MVFIDLVGVNVYLSAYKYPMQIIEKYKGVTNIEIIGIEYHQIHFLFYKQLGPVLSLQSCLYFQDFWGPKLLDGCLVV